MNDTWHYWIVSLSVDLPGNAHEQSTRPHRVSLKRGIVAATAEQAVALARLCVPEGASGVTVWCVAHHGSVDNPIGLLE